MKKVVILKTIKEEEWPAKRLVLKASNQFNDEFLNMLLKTNRYKLPIELSEEQAKALEELKLIDSYIELENEGRAEIVVKKLRETSLNLEEATARVNDGVEPVSDEPNFNENVNEELEEDKDGLEQNNDAREEGGDSLEGGNEEQDEKDEQEELKFEPESLEEIEEIRNMPEEERAKKYYLTADRIIETLENLNGGVEWQKLSPNPETRLIVQTAIRRAYETGIYESDFRNPEFLEKRIVDKLPADLKDGVHDMGLRELHKAAVLGTYVGWHVEKNEGDVKSLNRNGEQRKNIAVVKFPIIADEMPQYMKDWAEEDFTEELVKSINNIMRGTNPYKALTMLVPMEYTIDKAVDTYANGIEENENSNAMKAYIKMNRDNIASKIQEEVSACDISFDMHDIDWNNKTTREDIIAMIEMLQGNGEVNKIQNLIDELNLTIGVNSLNDMETVEATCKDLEKLTDMGIEVNVAFNIPIQELGNTELQAELNEVVDKYDINRDTVKEAEYALDNTTAEVVKTAVNMALVAGVSEVAINGIINDERENGELDDVKERIIDRLSILANGLEEPEKGIENDDPMERPRNTV